MTFSTNNDQSQQSTPHKFVNVHILHTVPYSNLNRDGAGAPKSMPYGGVTRARLSSQSLKRAARIRFESQSPAERTVRSVFAGEYELAPMLLRGLKEHGYNVSEEDREAITKKAAAAVRKLTTGKEASADVGDTLVWLAEADLHKQIAAGLAKLTDEDLKDAADSVLADLFDTMTWSLTMAAFGRMLAERPDLQLEAAVQVAHAFTTHQAALDVDYFTAADDLRKAVKGDAGAGHMNDSLFTTGTFYRFFSVDAAQLKTNWHGFGAPAAATKLQSFYEDMILTLPTGKVNATAPWTLPTLAVLELASQPLSYASAFEDPVPISDRGFEKPSVERLLMRRDAAHAAAGSLFGKTVVWRSDGEPSCDLSELTEAAAAATLRVV